MTPRQLKRSRERCNLSQNDAATEIGCSRRTIQKWEAGETVVPKSIEMAIKSVTCDMIEPEVTSDLVARTVMTKSDELDQIYGRAGFAAAEAHKELDEFLQEMRPPTTKEEREAAAAKFVELMNRANQKAFEIFERASNGDRAPHLTEVKKK